MKNLYAAELGQQLDAVETWLWWLKTGINGVIIYQTASDEKTNVLNTFKATKQKMDVRSKQ